MSNLDLESLRLLLQRVADGDCPVNQALGALRSLPFEDTGFARLDHHRAIRTGFSEVIFCAPKTPEQVAEIASRLAARHCRILGTRATPEQFEAAKKRVPELQYHPLAKALWMDREPERPRKPGVYLLAAGTADLPVAEEAAITLDLMGHSVEKCYDIGVAGLHRLLSCVATLQSANVIIVCAGMDGALPGVVAGLTACPVIGVPTSVGYGTSFSGLTPLLTMLNSCAAGLAVVNIDNGYGAAHLAATINNLAHRQVPET
ncbi:MAG TPA: nickel pincer cofactor biosynthesis protein LarB, partial [Verrucomicrobiae bacterium]|nr:nickel pincer cofactor biosynthesis protein LarB [Verrucomicrobiae bacterium]